MWKTWFKRPPVFREAAEEYLAISISHCCDQVKKYTYQRMETKVYPAIGSRRIHKIRPAEILSCLQKIGIDAPSQTRRVLQLISGVYRYAKIKGWCTRNPADGLGDMLPSYAYQGFKYLPAAQMPDFLAAVDTHVTLDAAAVTAFWLLAYTAVRRGEAVDAALSEFDLSAAVWNIPAERMKMRRPHVVPLAPQVVDLLRQWLEERARRGIGGNLLFGGMGGHRPLHVITQAGWRGKMTIHGFRKTFSTHAHESGLWGIDAIELQLAHAIPGVRGVYNKALMMDERRRLMCWYADEIDRWRNTGAGSYNDCT